MTDDFRCVRCGETPHGFACGCTQKAYDEVHAELEMTQDLAIRQGEMLRKIVNLVRGEPPPLVSWSVHDAVELVENALRSCGYFDKEGR